MRRKLFTRYGITIGIFLLTVLELGGVPAVTRADSSPIKQVKALTDTVGQYEKFEAVIDLDAKFKNPYDPAEVSLDGTFTSPSGRAVTAPGFYFRDFNFELSGSDPASTVERLSASSNWSWRVRFTPDEVGAWTYTIQVTTGGKTATSSAQHFTVNKSESHGFLRVSKQDFRYLEFDDGTPFFGIGLNMGWYNDGKLADYQRWLDRFQKAGGNLIRVWMAPWGFSPEWLDTPLGDYENRQNVAFELDKLFEMAEQRGIYIQLALLNHGQFSTTTNAEWDQNPYNAANGGPLQKPEEFATNAQALKLWHQRLRYIAARWGYSTHLMAWEWWNEVNWTPLGNPDILAPWIETSAGYLAPYDPYHHLITHSGSTLDHAKVWGTASMSITEAHVYQAPDWAFTLVTTARKWIDTYQKPFLMAEFGYGDKPQPETDPLGIRLHLGLWAGLMSGSLGTGQFWWWDSYIYPNDDRYQAYKGLAAFVAGEDLAAYQFKAATAKASRTSLADVYGMQNDRSALLWVVSGKYTDSSYQQLYLKNLGKKVQHPEQVTFPDVQGLKLTVKGLADGNYTIVWWNTVSGETIQTDAATSSAGVLEVEIPTFQTDLALKIHAAS